MDGATFINFVCLASMSCLFANSRRTPILNTSTGPVRGLIYQTAWDRIKYSSFKGIPYAEPPLRELRFKPPVPIKPWNEVLNAYHEGSMCPQRELLNNALMGNENCLYLNVFTPETSFTKRSRLRPVMVWIHGGAYRSGSSNSSLYGPDFFIEEDVVFVSFNYRLGLLGFLSLNHPNATGNAGLKDQNLVLRWVRTNIATFGGDPNLVTIFGESAGGTSVGFHVLSEQSKGLFLRSISMSGSPLCPWAYHPPENIIANAHYVAATLNFVPKNKDDLLNFLRRAPATDLVNGGELIGLDFLPFRPTIENPKIDPENAFLTECPITKYANGNFYKHSMMLGYTHDEVVYFLGPPIGIANVIDWAKKYLKNMAEHHERAYADPLNHLALFVEKLYNSAYEEGIKIATDIFFSGPIDLTQRLLAKYNGEHSIYYYRLSYDSQYSLHKKFKNPLNGTSHFDDVGYIFNVRVVSMPNDKKHPFNRFRRKMASMWANFAKYGNPTPEHLMKSKYNVAWINSGQSGWQLDIDENDVLHNRMVDKYTEIYTKVFYTILPTISSCLKRPTSITDIF